jgi:hypothetical protein
VEGDPVSGAGIGGRFKPGQSGNPAGRPKGASKAAHARALLLDAVPAAIEALRRAAAGGDVKAAAEVLRFALPPFKPVEAPLPLELDGLAKPTEQVRDVLQALLNAEISPEQAAGLLAALSKAGAAASAAKSAELFGF